MRQSGDPSPWLDRLIFFHNNTAGSGGSIVQELILNHSATSAMKGWSYQASPGIANQVMAMFRRCRTATSSSVASASGAVPGPAPDLGPFESAE